MYPQNKYELTLNINKIKQIVETSEQMTYARYLHSTGQLNLSRFNAPRPLAAYKSLKSQLKSDMDPVYTEFTHNVNWTDLRTNLLDYININMNPNIYEAMKAYALSKMDYHLAYFVPSLWLDQSVKYGINLGTWSTEDKRLFEIILNKYIEEIKWSKYDLSSLEPGIDDWNVLVDKCPYFNIIRHDASSGYPDYQQQTIARYVKDDHYYKLIHSDAKGYISAYTRLHGASIPEEYALGKIQGTPTIKIKVRWIAGDEEVDKVHGLPLTYSFRESAPSYTPYYKDWMIVFDEILNKYLSMLGDFAFTTDQSGFDQHHNTYLVKNTFELLMNTMPQHIKKFARKNLLMYNNPKMIINPFYYIRLGRYLSLSGVPATPLIETLNNLGVHKLILDKLGVDIKYHQCQIDDTIYFVDKEFKLTDFSDKLKVITGFDANATKTESSIKDYLVFLQNMIGSLMLEDDTQTIGRPFEGKYGYLGHIMRRAHRLQYRERLFQTNGGYDILYREDDGTMVQVPVHIARYIGTMSSLGPMAPEELLKLFINGTKMAIAKYTIKSPGKKGQQVEEIDFFDRVVDYCKRSDLQINDGEFGFSPKLFIQYLASNY